mgnify:FL=1
MSDERRKYTPKLFLLTDDQVSFILDEAKRRDPREYKTPGATRAQSGVARDIIDFARKNQRLFLSFVATRGHATIPRDDPQNNTTPGT